MDNYVLNTILMVFIVIVAAKMYLQSDSFNLRCIISNVNGNTS